MGVQIFDLIPGTRAFDEFTVGITYMVSGLKTLLDMGRSLLAKA